MRREKFFESRNKQESKGKKTGSGAVHSFEEEARPENEKAEEIPNLILREPVGDKNFMIIFDSGNNQDSTYIYNIAVNKVLKAHGLDPFHQIGEENKPGVHGWEIWKKSDKETMENLLPEIQAEARKMIEQW